MENVNPAKRQRCDFHFQQWARPELSWTPSEGALLFMQVDIDYYTETPHASFWPGLGSETKVPVLRMYGVTEGGNSVLAHIHGFLPYFYVPCPDGFEDTTVFGESLEMQLAEAGVREKVNRYVLDVKVVQRSSLMYWVKSEHSSFFQVTVAVPSLVSTSRNMVERGFPLVRNRGHFDPSTSYETNIPFALRFMVDRGIMGGGWVKLDESLPTNGPGRLYTRSKMKNTNTCQLEVDIHYEQVAPVEMMKIAPLRIFSFDIECYNQEGKGFPQASKNPVIQIAVYLKEFGAKEPLMQGVWTLGGSCADIAGSQVFVFDKEEEMLASFQDFIVKTDPDIMTGYNIQNFDLPYLLERAETLGLRPFAQLGRMKERSRVRTNTFGGREVTEVNIEGRVQFDMIVAIQKEYKLRSYSLNAVSAEFLGEQKEDVHYSMIGDLFTTNDETRRRLAVYCLKDAYLPLKLMEKLLFMYNYVEMARVTGTPINYLLNRGQMIKVTSQLLRKARQHDFVMPTQKSQPSEDKYEGATVLDPITGYYAKPIATLDFASLYPSIMMAHNLCYTTLLTPEGVSKVPGEEVTTTPSGCKFVKAQTRRGLLPMILEELLAARKKAKKEMKEATDPLTYMVLDGRQLALKISANSVYGFTGATVGQLPCLEISSSVTAFGRQMIDQTKAMVEAKYTIQNGFEHDAQVVYGDTDSVMVKFGTDSIATAMDMGREAADMVSQTFIRPIKLEFEKVYCPYLLMNKKRYAGLYWTKPEKYDKLDTKGIETVRRDNCGLVRILVDTVLQKILIEKSIEGATEYVQTIIGDLLQNKVDLSLLVITKSLGKGAHREDYAVKQAHVELAERIRKRDPSSAPGSGDRVPYVITSAAKNVPAYDRSEDPLYVLENNLSIDAQYYIEHQLQQPLMRIFGPIMPNAESVLFHGAHTLVKSNPTPATGALAKFVTKSLRCLGCKAVIKQGSLCSHCLEEKGAEVVLSRVHDLREKEAEYNRLWTQCQRCQGSLMQPVICSNRDCDIFYRRAKARRDVESIQESIKRLQIDVKW
jgi:DNA polymerase delta subunit 1